MYIRIHPKGWNIGEKMAEHCLELFIPFLGSFQLIVPIQIQNTCQGNLLGSTISKKSSVLETGVPKKYLMIKKVTSSLAEVTFS